MKYIIDIPDEVVEFVGSEMNIFIEPKIKTGEQRHYAFRLSNEDIAIYTEPDYRKSIEDEVWDFASWYYNNLSEEEFDECYDGWPPQTYQEAKTKYEAWLKQKDEIRVGDEVKHRGLNYVVGYVGADKVYHLIDKNWLRTVVQGGYQLIKTGRHFPEVEELLKKMRGNND